MSKMRPNKQKIYLKRPNLAKKKPILIKFGLQKIKINLSGLGTILNIFTPYSFLYSFA